MANTLTGAEYDTFVAAFERVVLDFAEALRLASQEPSGQEEWRAIYVELAGSWFRMGDNIAEMVKAATGEDVQRFFGRPSAEIEHETDNGRRS